MNLTAFFNFILGLIITIKYAATAGFPGGWHWFLLPLWLLIGLFASVLIRFAFSICVFWTERSWAFSRLYYQFFIFASKPDTFYPYWLRTAVRTIIPFAFIGSIPARALLHGLSSSEYLLVATVLSGFFLLNRALWNAGLRRYQSSSS
jgi:ABC-type uncharacterized transport system permease subunit